MISTILVIIILSWKIHFNLDKCSIEIVYAMDISNLEIFQKTETMIVAAG